MLEITALCKSFGDRARKAGRVHAVDHVDVVVEEGEFFTMLGPSGCGKTTTLRCVAGLEKPDSGDIVIGGTTVYSSSRGVFVPPNRRRLGMVFQSYAIWPHMNVFDNVAFPFRTGMYKAPRAEVRSRVERALAVVHMEHLAGRFATQLSGGQQQRLALARALVIEPTLLLLDEPLSNLDAKLRESLRFELKRLQRERGITTLYVTHDQIEALAFSNRIAVMEGGRIQQIGTPTEVYLKPDSPFVADFVGTTNFVPGTVGTKDPETGRWRIDTSSGPVRCGALWDVAPGDACVISIRPEHVLLSKADSGLGEAWKGRVLTRLFVGEVWDYQVQVGDQVLRSRSSGQVRFSSGEEVLVTVDDAESSAFPASAAPTPDAA